MSNLCFYVSSITNAMRGKALLERNGIRSFITRSANDTVRNGCGYCIVVSQNQQQAERLLRSAGIRIRDQRQIEGAP